MSEQLLEKKSLRHTYDGDFNGCLHTNKRPKPAAFKAVNANMQIINVNIIVEIPFQKNRETDAMRWKKSVILSIETSLWRRLNQLTRCTFVTNQRHYPTEKSHSSLPTDCLKNIE